MSSFINEELFVKQMRATLNEQMIQAAEPLVKQALGKVEVEMRKRLAEMLVSAVSTSYSLERDGRDIVVRVRMGEHDAR